MRYIDEYRNPEHVGKLARLIAESSCRDYSFMEVCGGHTAAIHRFGIPSMLPSSVRLLSGPGCPVCVTGTAFIDKALSCASMDGTIITTFGDMMRVPGSVSSLEKEKSKGADVRVVLSAHDALEIAKQNPAKKVIFLAIGFETTAPGTAVTVLRAEKERVKNFFVLCAHKTMPPAMEAILSGESRIDGFICPGHVAAVTGSGIFDFIPEKFRTGCVVSGFEPVDLLMSILMLVNQVNNNRPSVEIEYKRAVTASGNIIASAKMDEVFEGCDSEWRGLGMIRSGGLKIKEKYRNFDADSYFQVETNPGSDNKACICGDILRGVKQPSDCRLFSSVCNPENPAGACMVSAEGSCNAWYRYRVAI